MRQIHLKLSDAFVAQLDAMKETTDATSRVDVIRDAVCMYAWALSQIQGGNRIQSVSDTGTGTTEFATAGMVMAQARKP